MFMYHQKTYLYGKERWISFGFLCISTLIILLAAFLTNQIVSRSILLVMSLLNLLLAGMVLKMNLRRKRIQKEFIYELDKDIRSKEVLCPTCGAKIGASGICPKCGYCRKN